MTPLLNTGSDVNTRCNVAHKRSGIIEQCFGILKRRFPACDHLAKCTGHNRGSYMPAQFCHAGFSCEQPLYDAVVLEKMHMQYVSHGGKQ